MTAAASVVLVSTYELGHQPLALASAAAALRARGHRVRCIDLAVEALDTEAVAGAGLIAVSMPMHTAARLGVALARQLRSLNASAHVAAYGLYAGLLTRELTEDGTFDSALGGDYDEELFALADAVDGGRPYSPGGPVFARRQHLLPDRSGLPALARYARAVDAPGERVVGYVEATRGCAHRCTHCPLTPAFGGRLRLVQAEVVLADIEQQVAMGAEHITFGDADFFNATRHSLGIVEELRQRHPHVTFDATIKVEHIIEHASLLPRLREAGCLFVTTAFESCNDAVLGYLAKGHTRADLGVALDLAAGAGIALRPTWVAFTPWGGVEDFAELLAFVEEHGLVRHVQPVQYTLRLLLPPGSPLVALLGEQGLLGDYDPEALTYTWESGDERLDALHAEVCAIVEQAGCTTDEVEVFARVKRAALGALRGYATPVEVAPQPLTAPPGLTEAWFCCAEPTAAQFVPLVPLEALALA